MTVIILEKVAAGIRGELSKWMVEVSCGVFLGKPSALVREKLWEKITDKAESGRTMLIYSYSNEQGFIIKSRNQDQYVPTDFEGVTLIMHPKKDTPRVE